MNLKKITVCFWWEVTIVGAVVFKLVSFHRLAVNFIQPATEATEGLMVGEGGDIM